MVQPSPTPAPEPTPTSPGALNVLIEFILGLLDPAGSQTHKITSYLADAAAILGGLVGVFNRQWGIDLTVIPQSVLLGVSALVLLGVNVYRIYTTGKIAMARASALDSAVKAFAVAHTMQALDPKTGLSVTGTSEQCAQFWAGVSTNRSAAAVSPPA